MPNVFSVVLVFVSTSVALRLFSFLFLRVPNFSPDLTCMIARVQCFLPRSDQTAKSPSKGDEQNSTLSASILEFSKFEIDWTMNSKTRKETATRSVVRSSSPASMMLFWRSDLQEDCTSVLLQAWRKQRRSPSKRGSTNKSSSRWRLSVSIMA